MARQSITFLDSSTVIYLLEGHASLQARTRAALAAARKTRPESLLATSVISRLECRVKPLREGNQELLARYEHFFSHPGLFLVQFDPAVIDRATELRAHHRLKTPDALQAACALKLSDSPAFITGDTDFNPVPGLDLITIEP